MCQKSDDPFSKEEIRANIVIVDNFPVVDKTWFISALKREISRRRAELDPSAAGPLQLASNLLNVGNNLAKIKINRKYIYKLKEFLDKIDEKIEQWQLRLLTMDERPYDEKVEVLVQEVKALTDRLDQIMKNYKIEYNRSLLERVKLIGSDKSELV